MKKSTDFCYDISLKNIYGPLMVFFYNIHCDELQLLDQHGMVAIVNNKYNNASNKGVLWADK